MKSLEIFFRKLIILSPDKYFGENILVKPITTCGYNYLVIYKWQRNRELSYKK
jgi:hypothetical protein